MRAVVQRVASAAVTVVEDAGERAVGAIDRGMVVLLGVGRDDGPADVAYIAGKIKDLRLFDDDAGTSFARSIQDVRGSVLLVSQFTLGADCRKGRRPSFDAAAPAPVARPLYESVVGTLRTAGIDVVTGEFQASMRVSLVNEGPITLLLDSRKTF